MNNRKLIERFCKEHEFEIIKLEFKRNTDAEYDCKYRADYWDLTIKLDDVVKDFYTIRHLDTITEEIYKMFDEILDDSANAHKRYEKVYKDYSNTEYGISSAKKFKAIFKAHAQNADTNEDADKNNTKKESKENDNKNNSNIIKEKEIDEALPGEMHGNMQ